VKEGTSWLEVLVRSRFLYRGTFELYRAEGRWKAQLRVNGKDRYLGFFEDELAAALAYDEAARSHRGASAKLNFPDRDDKDGPGPVQKEGLAPAGHKTFLMLPHCLCRKDTRHLRTIIGSGACVLRRPTSKDVAYP
jgi:hypothetical protein